MSDDIKEDLEQYIESFRGSSLERIQRHIDQECEMAGCARQDGDQADSARRLLRVNRLRQLVREET